MIEFIRRNESTNEFYFCFCRDKTTRVALSALLIGDYFNFTNNGVEFCLAKLHKLHKVDDFAQKVSISIDLAEQKGGNLNEKLKTFREAFPGNINVILSEGSQFDVCLIYNWNCYVKVYRGSTKYTAWLCGDEFETTIKKTCSF